MISDKEYINQVRRRLQSYTTYEKEIKRWSLRILELETKINSVASGSPKKLPEGTADDKDWRSPLFEQIEMYKRLIITNELMLELIKSFVSKLEDNDKDIIYKLYLVERKPTYKQVCEEFRYTREGLRDRVEALILKYWEY